MIEPWLHRLPRTLALATLDLYRSAISPFTPPACRYLPTCSVYAREAVDRHGAWAGLCLAAARLARCHPWGGHGYDPVPGREEH